MKPDPFRYDLDDTRGVLTLHGELDEVATVELRELLTKVTDEFTTYLAIDLDMAYHAHHLFEDGDKQGIEIEMSVLGNRRTLRGIGSGPIAATVNALALPIRIDNYEERALRAGADASALAIVEAARDGVAGIRYGAGRHSNIATASVLAVLSAARRLGVSARDLAKR